MRRLVLAIVLLVVMPGVASAGAGGVDTSGCPGYGEGDSITMLDSCFSGTAHFAPGGTITVSNGGQLPHTLTAVDGSFDTGMLQGGQSADLAIDEPGIYRVFCSLHGTPQGEGMAGVVVVGEAMPATMSLAADSSAGSEAMAADSPTSPQVVALTEEVGPVQMVVLLIAGLAAGLALAAILTVLRLRIGDDSSRALDRLEPRAGS